MSVDLRRDAFCGKISVCNNLYQYGIPFTLTRLHTCDVESKEFETDLKDFAAVCRVVKGLRSARIGAIGARPAPFQTMRFSEKILQATGITVVPVDLSEIIGAAQRMSTDDPRVRQKVDEIYAYGKVAPSIPREKVILQAKLSLAVEDFMEENELDASAIQCWESIQLNYGCATCLTMSMMGERLMPSACEVDVTGAISMYALALASGNPPALLDWNNNFDYSRDMCVGTHCSNYPRGFMGQEVEIGNLDVLGKTLGPERCFGAVKGHVGPGDMTFFRISTDDGRGKIKAYLGEGEFTADPYGMDGGIAVCRVPRMNDLLRYITKYGFEHHVAMARGRWSAVLREAVETYLGWDLYVHEG
ncbi:L-fucose/L-arabinose isomerase family protein [Spirochaeta thermophila]|uniref:L-fucose/L-arabinose isomerase family protein n=1 Tax=Winmispira thermophila TaxID=154 RepID=UPI001FE10B04|nr:fucose isomerase [Spirochaeta thermophila]